MSPLKVGDHVYLLSGLDVEEWEVYEIREEGRFGGPWIKRDGRLGMAASHFLNRVFDTLDEAVAVSKTAREREIRQHLRAAERLALNPNVKVKLLKPKHSRHPKNC